MDGCQYHKPKFTLPASQHTTQAQWDLAFLSKEEFKTKYKLDEKAYKWISS